MIYIAIFDKYYLNINNNNPCNLRDFSLSNDTNFLFPNSMNVLQRCQLSYISYLPEYLDISFNPDTEYLDYYDILIFCDDTIKNNIIDQGIVLPEDKFVYWAILEPVEICNDIYNYDLYAILNNKNICIQQIFTHDEDILRSYKNSYKMPIAGAFIHKDDAIVYEKTKNISFILSKKNQFNGHKLRIECATNCMDYIEGRFGSFCDNSISIKLIGLKDFRYHMVSENVIKSNYFTEKIIDCFLTGTIPIYCGAHNIGDFFDSRGVLYFNNVEECKNIIENVGEKEYTERLPFVKINYNIAKYYANYFGNLISLTVEHAVTHGFSIR